MSTLTLTVLRHPEYGAEQRRQAQGSTLTIGRGAECDWALPDPLKSLSRRHCQLEQVAGGWQVRDLSSNGTFLNASAVAVGRDKVHPIADNDLLRLGDYEVEVRVNEDVTQAMPPHGRPDAAERPPLPFGEAAPRGFAAARLPGLDDPVSAALQQSAQPPLHSYGAVSDHVAASNEAFSPPRVSTAPAAHPIVPDDWYRQLDPAPAVAPPAAAPWVVPAVAAPAPTTAAPAAAPVPVPAAAAAGAGRPAEPAGDMAAAVALLMAGAELPPDVALRAAADPQAVLRIAGAMLRTAVGGIRALLIARGSVKREFRIEQTMLMAQENNLLKFAASDEQALSALLDPRTPSLRAVKESVRDLTLHQVAVLAATQAAARALLDQLDPSPIEAADPGGGLFSDSLEKRLWEAYKRKHAKLTEQFEDDFESAFGKSFARAYEQAVRKDDE